MDIQVGSCFTACNNKYSALDPYRLYCKKGCSAQEEGLDACKTGKCDQVCFRKALGEDESKLGSWSRFFSRAPEDPKLCFEACAFGCFKREE